MTKPPESDQFMPEFKDTEIDHPFLPSWNQTQFTQPESMSALLFDALVIAHVQTQQYRSTHEAQNLVKLGLSFSEPGEYGKLAGQPKKMGDFISWFGGAALKRFIDTPVMGSEKIALELGGKRQFGDWESTGDLDKMVKSIPWQLSERSPTLEILPRKVPTKVGETSSSVLNYLFMPKLGMDSATFDFKRRLVTYVFDYGVIRRRRPVANIQLPGGAPVRIYKEAYGLLFMNDMDEQSASAVRSEYSAITPERFEYLQNTNNTEPALATGGVLERGIERESPEAMKLVTPVSAHYVMVSENIDALRSIAKQA